MSKYISWIPTTVDNIEAFFELCPVTASDIVYDLGSGDGRLLLSAAEKGALKCVGIDIDPDMVKISNETAKSKHLSDRITFIEADINSVDLSQASIIFCYIHPAASEALKPKFEGELKPGTKIVMESFPVMGWKPEKVIDNGVSFYLYVIPAQTTEDYMEMVGTAK
jgi:ribosomal protein L11 methylase PrmA